MRPPHPPKPLTRLWPFLLVTITLALGALACNLASPPPPTIPPRLPTGTPQATIGISTLVPIALPEGVQGEEAPAAPDVDALLRQVDSDRLMLTVQTLQNFQTRHVNSAQDNDSRGIGAARRFIFNAFQSYNDASQGRLTVWEHAFTLNWGELETLQKNVVAILAGTAQGGGVVVVSAHYDSITTDWANGEVYAPGADDNASGVAALLEIARIMSQTPHRATIMFVAFSAEETGRQGSIRFVDEYLAQQGIDVRAVITMDMLGSITGPDGQVNDSQIRLFSAEPNDSPSRQLGRAIHLIATTYVPDLQVALQLGEDRQGRWGDHLSFNARGFPAVRLIETAENPTRQHNAQDTIDQVSPFYLTRATRVALAALAVLADGLPPPGNLSVRVNPADPANPTLVWAPVEGAAGYVIALRQLNALTYNQILTVGASPTSLTWSGFNPQRFEAVALATVDETGRWGPFSPEYRITGP